MNEILAVSELTVSFDGFMAVDGLTFAVENNELVIVRSRVVRPPRHGVEGRISAPLANGPRKARRERGVR